MFGHEKLRAYQPSIEFVALASEVLDGISRGHSDLRDQLKRAAVSIPLNIAEGSGKTSQRDKQRFYPIARGSAMECAAILDVLYHLELINKGTREKGRASLNTVVGILTTICGQ